MNPIFLSIAACWMPASLICEACFPVPEDANPNKGSTCQKTIRSLGLHLQSWGVVLRTGPFIGTLMNTSVRYFGLQKGLMQSMDEGIQPFQAYLAAGMIADLWGQLLENLSYQR